MKYNADSLKKYIQRRVSDIYHDPNRIAQQTNYYNTTIEQFNQITLNAFLLLQNFMTYQNDSINMLNGRFEKRTGSDGVDRIYFHSHHYLYLNEPVLITMVRIPIAFDFIQKHFDANYYEAESPFYFKLINYNYEDYLDETILRILREMEEYEDFDGYGFESLNDSSFLDAVNANYNYLELDKNVDSFSAAVSVEINSELKCKVFLTNDAANIVFDEVIISGPLRNKIREATLSDSEFVLSPDGVYSEDEILCPIALSLDRNLPLSKDSIRICRFKSRPSFAPTALFETGKSLPVWCFLHESYISEGLPVIICLISEFAWLALEGDNKLPRANDAQLLKLLPLIELGCESFLHSEYFIESYRRSFKDLKIRHICILY